jgi:hypothetical protein
MPNRDSTPAELEKANVMLADVRERLKAPAGDDATVLFA